MSPETLKIYQQLYTALLRERDDIDNRLHDVEGILGGDVVPLGAPRKGRKAEGSGAKPSRAPVVGARRGRKPKGELSLKQAIIQVTSNAPKTRDEILEAVQGIGYTFTTDKPGNSINQVVYGKNPKFKNEGGKFSPIGVTAEPSPAPPETGPVAEAELITSSTPNLPLGDEPKSMPVEDEAHIVAYTLEKLAELNQKAEAEIGNGSSKRKGRKSRK